MTEGRNNWSKVSGGKCHLADGTLAQVGFQNAYPALLVRQGDVDELIQTAGSQDGRVDDVWPVGGSDNKDVLLTGHSIHLGQDLVDNAVGCSAAISHVATAGFSYGVQLIEEENAGGCLTSLGARKTKEICENLLDQHFPPLRDFLFDCKVLALSKISLTLASDSPNHMVSSSGPLMEMKFAWHSLAMALASRVFPQPGGP